MTHLADAALIVQTVSAFLYVTLGAWVLTLKPRRLQTKLLGAFAILFGMRFLPTDLGMIFHLVERGSLLKEVIQAPFGGLASITALGLAWAVPESLEDRRLLGTAVALGVAIPAVLAGIEVAVPRTGPRPMPIWAHAAELLVVLGGLYAAVVLLALRARPARDPSRSEVTQLALLGVALAMLNAFALGGWGIPASADPLAAGDPMELLFRASFTLFWLGVAGLWGWNMTQAGVETRRIHRAALLGILGLLAAGAVYYAVLPSADPGSNVMRGVMRTLGVGLLAYGILRHDLAGLDAKVEWTVSKTTVAGVFVAVFFIVSEGAQVLFAGFAQNELLGVIAAGALLFALAPIQRLADRIAERAVPSGATDEEETYRITAAKYLADGELTAEEERHLARLADRLGIDAERAVELRQEVGEQAGGKGS